MSTAVAEAPISMKKAGRRTVECPITGVMRKFAEKYHQSKEKPFTPWEGTAGQLLKLVKEIARREGDTDAKQYFPESARMFDLCLFVNSRELKAQGIIVSKRRRSSLSRQWQVYSEV